ncbi:MAG: hypothetical protein U5K33_07610 [Halofilum sp. (in: g-proteobacteria)]|nr:hypothetical protein [Halofilum sp. (in: g-proteobacteria)]
MSISPPSASKVSFDCVAVQPVTAAAGRGQSPVASARAGGDEFERAACPVGIARVHCSAARCGSRAHALDDELGLVHQFRPATHVVDGLERLHDEDAADRGQRADQHDDRDQLDDREAPMASATHGHTPSPPRS